MKFSSKTFIKLPSITRNSCTIFLFVDAVYKICLQILRENGNNGHLVGNALTLADLGLLEVLLYLKDYYDEGVLKDYHATQVQLWLSGVF